MRQVSSQVNIYNATVGARAQLVSAFRHTIAMITITSGGTAGAVIKFGGSGQEAKPDFTAAATAANFHAPVQIKDLNTGTTYNGSLGIPATATGIYLVEINTNLLSWLSVIDIAAANGAVFNVDILSANND